MTRTVNRPYFTPASTEAPDGKTRAMTENATANQTLTEKPERDGMVLGSNTVIDTITFPFVPDGVREVQYQDSSGAWRDVLEKGADGERPSKPADTLDFSPAAGAADTENKEASAPENPKDWGCKHKVNEYGNGSAYLRCNSPHQRRDCPAPDLCSLYRPAPSADIAAALQEIKEAGHRHQTLVKATYAEVDKVAEGVRRDVDAYATSSDVRDTRLLREIKDVLGTVSRIHQKTHHMQPPPSVSAVADAVVEAIGSIAPRMCADCKYCPSQNGETARCPAWDSPEIYVTHAYTVGCMKFKPRFSGEAAVEAMRSDAEDVDDKRCGNCGWRTHAPGTCQSWESGRKNMFVLSARVACGAWVAKRRDATSPAPSRLFGPAHAATCEHHRANGGDCRAEPCTEVWIGRPCKGYKQAAPRTCGSCTENMCHQGGDCGAQTDALAGECDRYKEQTP